MSTKVLTPLDFQRLELLNMRFQQLASAPTSPSEGWTYWDTTLHQLGVYTGSAWAYLGSGAGSVTNVSVATANGFAGTVANASTTPTITLTTTITGLLKGNGTAISAAVSGTDYAPATNGTTGQVLVSNGSGGFGTAVAGSVTIAGTTVTLGNSISLDTITGLSSVGLVKRSAANTLVVATSGTDYAPPTSGSAILKGNGSGGFASASAGTDYAAPTTGSNGQVPIVNGSGGWGTSVTLDTDGTLAANSDTRIATQKAVKTYVDTYAQGLDFKASARVIATTNGALATAYANGQVVDGVTLATGDRILLAGQTTGSENGIYTVNASGAPTRGTDADASGEISKGALIYIEAGTAHTGQLWVCSGTGATPWVPGSSTSTWTQFAGAADITATSPITKTGNAIGINLGSGLTSSGGNAVIDTTVVVRKFAATIGDGTSTSIAVTHSLGTQDITVSVRDATTNAFVYCDVTANSSSQVTLGFAVAPASNSLRVVVHG
jgi:hypothetical protein